MHVILEYVLHNPVSTLAIERMTPHDVTASFAPSQTQVHLARPRCTCLRITKALSSHMKKMMHISRLNRSREQVHQILHKKLTKQEIFFK